uniref:28 kDa Metastriate family member n=1 Tax=Rhipicephalus zambeziensis TaxID=60191 RepID=A0A224YBK8_9ACAR
MYGLRYLVFCSMCILSSISLAFGAKQRTPRESIGEGIHVTVKARYDSAFKQDNTTEQLRTHFQNIFQRVQGEFYKRFINVTFEVKESEQEEELVVYYDNATKLVNGNETLEKLKKEAEALKEMSSIYYFFSGQQIFENETMLQDGLYTPGTFCTTDGTAAVLQSMADPRFWMTPYKLTSFMFGSTHSPPREGEDYRKINETFQKCLAPSTGTLH